MTDPYNPNDDFNEWFLQNIREATTSADIAGYEVPIGPPLERLPSGQKIKKGSYSDCMKMWGNHAMCSKFKNQKK